MRLSTQLRYAVGALGSVLVIVSITALLLHGDGTAITGYGLIGALMLLIALVGAVPDLMWNENRGMLWPPLDVLQRIEVSETLAASYSVEVQELRKDIESVRELVMDHMRIQQKSPRIDGNWSETEFGESIESDEQLLDEMERHVNNLHHEWSVLCYEGEPDKEGVREMLARARAAWGRELRRQRAVKRMEHIILDEDF